MRNTYALHEQRDAPFLAYTVKGAPFFQARLFLRGTALDRAAGDSGRARSLLSEFIPPRGPLVAPKQVHGNTVMEAHTYVALPENPEADGIHISRQGIEGSLRFADCVPVIIASDTPKPHMAILHSGYKGTVLNISGGAYRRYFGKNDDPSRTYAWIGPGIGGDVYFRRMGEPWTERGLESFSERNVRREEDRVYFDLAGEIRHQLLHEGMEEDNICVIPICTFQRNDICYSYRKGDRQSHLFLLAFLDGDMPLLGSFQ